VTKSVLQKIFEQGGSLTSKNIPTILAELAKHVSVVAGYLNKEIPKDQVVFSIGQSPYYYCRVLEKKYGRKVIFIPVSDAPRASDDQGARFRELVSQLCQRKGFCLDELLENRKCTLVDYTSGLVSIKKISRFFLGSLKRKVNVCLLVRGTQGDHLPPVYGEKEYHSFSDEPSAYEKKFTEKIEELDKRNAQALEAYHLRPIADPDDILFGTRSNKKDEEMIEAARVERYRQERDKLESGLQRVRLRVKKALLTAAPFQLYDFSWEGTALGSQSRVIKLRTEYLTWFYEDAVPRGVPSYPPGIWGQPVPENKDQCDSTIFAEYFIAVSIGKNNLPLLERGTLMYWLRALGHNINAVSEDLPRLSRNSVLTREGGPEKRPVLSSVQQLFKLIKLEQP